MDIKDIAIYVRVSTEEQAEEGFSIQAQLETLRQYAQSKNYRIYNEYKDEGISGKSVDNRPGLMQMREDAKRGKFQQVIVWKINRISRKQLDLLMIADELKKHGVAFRSYTENFETETPIGQFALQMMGAVAELERNQIVDNVKMGMKQRARQGKWNGGVVLGYDVIEVENSTYRKRKETRLAVNKSEARLVQTIFELYAGGKGLKMITNELNHNGFRSKHGRPFSTNTIKTILSNPLYIGKIRFNKQEDWNTKRRNGTNTDPIIVQGEHEAIITEDLWGKVQTRYSVASKSPNRVFFGSFPFTGVLRCPQCGHGMVAQRATRKRKNGERYYTLYYQCGQFANKGSSICKANSVRADYVEQEILARIQKLVNQPQLIEAVTRSVHSKKLVDREQLEAEAKHIAKDLADIERRKSKSFQLFEDDLLDSKALIGRMNELTKRENELLRKKKGLETKLSDNQADPVDYVHIRDVLGEFARLFKQISNDRRKQMVHSLIKNITVTQDRKIDAINFNMASYPL
ncbi:DNA-invertase hin [compost metagenome]